MNDEVHRTHCCAGIHGCKYLSDYCPVQRKCIQPRYKCQDCEEERQELAQRLAAMPPAELDALLRLAGLRGRNGDRLPAPMAHDALDDDGDDDSDDDWTGSNLMGG